VRGADEFSMISLLISGSIWDLVFEGRTEFLKLSCLFLLDPVILTLKNCPQSKASALSGELLFDIGGGWRQEDVRSTSTQSVRLTHEAAAIQPHQTAIKKPSSALHLHFLCLFAEIRFWRPW
jgi:hypothetical protein